MPRLSAVLSRALLLMVLVAATLVAMLLTVGWAAGIVDSLPARGERAGSGVYLAAALGFLVGPAAHLVAHEGAHLLAALALRLPVLGVRAGPWSAGVQRTLPGTSGHVVVDLGRARRWLPGRVIVMFLAGPAGNVALAVALAAVATGTAGPAWTRAACAGAAAVGLVVVVVNLWPAVLPSGAVTDGRQVLSWLLRPAAARARSRADVARARPGGVLAGTTVGPDRHALRAAVADPRPGAALAAVTELLRTRPRHDDGRADAPLLLAFAQRTDVAGDVRAALAGNYALSLGLARARRLPATQPNDPTDDEVQVVAVLAEHAVAADPTSVQARTAWGLAQVLQGEPARATHRLVDVPQDASAVLRGRALAVRALAAVALDDAEQAARLIASARELAPDDALVALATARSAASAGERPA